MEEKARRDRNRQRLTQLHSVFARRIADVIAALEAAGYRPRIEDAWRSPADQLNAFKTGHSKLKFGFHNVTDVNGRPEGLAVDLLDDDFPLNSRGDYLLQLASAADAARCRTGIAWGLPPALAAAVATAVRNRQWDARVKIGWDPTHVEPADLTVAEAQAGKRPSSVRSKRRRGSAAARKARGRRSSEREPKVTRSKRSPK